MKKFIFLCLMAILTVTVSAQKLYTFTNDTLTNGDTVYFTYPTQFSGNYAYAFETRIDSLTGTAVTPIATLQGSVTNGNWFNIGSSITMKPPVGGVKYYIHVFTGSYLPFYKYRIQIINTGTNTVACKSKWLWKPV